jgi:uncharacterized protein (TIGR00730 family)
MSRVCVFAGARGKAEFTQVGYEAGAALASAGHEVVFGGSSRGTMGKLAEGVEDRGGNLVGVLPDRIARLKHGSGYGVTVVTRDMNDRKEYFWACDAFLMLPGGVGTYNELFEYWTLAKLGYLPPKPCVVVNHEGYYDSLEALANEMVQHGFNSEDRRGLITFVRTVSEAMAVIAGNQDATQALEPV